MYIIQFLFCVAQGCVILEQHPFVVYEDRQSCEAAALVQVKELMVLLDDKAVEAVATRCVDKSGSIV